MIRFYIDPDSEKFQPELAYLLKVWAKNKGTVIGFSDNPDEAVTIGRSERNAVRSEGFFSAYDATTLNDQCLFVDRSGKPDYLLTAFYMLNAIQEFRDQSRDELGRFRFVNSYQHRFRNSNENIVQHCFDEISKNIGLSPRREPSSFFLTHDIDLVNGALVEDGFNVLKRGRIDLFFQMLLNAAVGKPDWLNMDKIMKIESEYDCKSVFFWIVNKGRINARERNGDYLFQSPKIQKQHQLVEQAGNENGIHKSISTETFNQEFEKYGYKPFSNRYHYLKFNLPQAYHDIEAAGLKLDASLGFAEEIGFRNSYGLPFNPYNFEAKKPFSFVEVPLHVMDMTFFQYKKYSAVDAEKDVIDFFEKNKENCVLSVLWHNNFFTNHKFKGYLDLYKGILSYIKENNFKTMSQKEIVEKYSIV